MATHSDILKKKLLEALEKSLGVVTTACKQVGCARSTFYDYMAKDQEFKKAVMFSSYAHVCPHHPIGSTGGARCGGLGKYNARVSVALCGRVKEH